MPTGREALANLKTRLALVPPGSTVWLDLIDKLDLCKLTENELRGEFGAVAPQVCRALNRLDMSELGKVLGYSLQTKFRLIVERLDGVARVHSDRREDCAWVIQYLRETLKECDLTEPRQIQGSAYWHFDVRFDNVTTAYRLLETLSTCPACVLVRTFSLSVAEQPHYVVQPYNLAEWILDQGDEAWWTVDGDPRLMSQLEFPAPPDELSEVIRRVNRPLLVVDPSGKASGEELLPEEINRVLEADEYGNRRLQLCWQGSPDGWLLIEEQPTSEHPVGA
jgi:hypothetical protein